LVIYPWQQEDEAKPVILLSSEIPGHVSAFKAYFHRAHERVNGGNMQVSVYLGHTTPFAELREDIDWWLRDNKFGWYHKALQVEKTKVLGWLLYSTGTMSLATLTATIFKATGAEVGLRWRIIPTGGKYVAGIDQSLLTRAIHVEVEDNEYAA
jgi:hypothetical protein